MVLGDAEGPSQLILEQYGITIYSIIIVIGIVYLSQNKQKRGVSKRGMFLYIQKSYYNQRFFRIIL